MTNQNRQSPGAPSGGQFAPQPHAEVDIVLSDEPTDRDGPKVHVFESSGEAYDDSQTEDDIDDGDLLIVPSEKVAGFLFKAWPVAVTSEPGTFHTPEGGFDKFLADNPEYGASYLAAVEAAKDL